MSKKKTEEIYIAQVAGHLSTGKSFKEGDTFAKGDLTKEDFDALREMFAIATTKEIAAASAKAGEMNADAIAKAAKELGKGTELSDTEIEVE